MEAYLCRGRFIVNLKNDWLVMMSLGGAVVSFYHVTSWYNSHQFFFLPHQNLAKSHHLSSGAKGSKPLKYKNTDIREQNIYNYD